VIWLFELERGLFRLYLLVLCISLLRRAFRRRTLPTPPAPTRWPAVTVQVLLCDEPEVAARAIAHATALHYPGTLHIDLLDDSADAEPVARAAAGTSARVLRRPDRAGAKAGNLAAGLARAEGELLAIFDADAAPAPDFLVRTVPHLVADPRIAFVQTRQTFPNRGENLLTRAQGLLLDGLMRVEQPGQSHRDRPVHFNGSAGVWRKQAIEAVGGWSGATSAEDLDLSHRVALAGWRSRSLDDVAVASELPEDMRVFRVQQARWTRGKVEVLRREWRDLVRARLPFGARLDLLVPAAARLLSPFLLFLCLTMPLTTFDLVEPAIRYGVTDGAVIFAVVTLCAVAYYGRASGVRAVIEVPLTMALLIGLSLSSTRALFGRGPTSFVRTPKRGAGPPPRVTLPVGERICAVIEVALGVGYVVLSLTAALHELFLATGFFAFVALAWMWVGASSLKTK
jgi:cellulose synthase/poly-beta-1,6-N-acetylglucosamine synthase-like glycosyltransferase